MIKSQRRKFTSEFKSKVVLETISEKQTLGEVALKFDLDRNQVLNWKKEFIRKAHLVFELEDDAENQSETNDE